MKIREFTRNEINKYMDYYFKFSNQIHLATEFIKKEPAPEGQHLTFNNEIYTSPPRFLPRKFLQGGMSQLLQKRRMRVQDGLHRLRLLHHFCSGRLLHVLPVSASAKVLL